MSGDKPKGAGGRPLKFKNKKVLQEKIDGYFAECDPHIAIRPAMVFQKNAAGMELRKLSKVPGVEEYVTEQVPYTITGLAMALKTSRDLLLRYEELDEYYDTITCAKLKIHNFAERLLMTSKNPSGVQFNLKKQLDLGG